jgi:hypothetical protein
MLIYKATQRTRSTSGAGQRQKTAIKEAFDNPAAGIDKGIKAGGMGGEKAS